MLSNTRLPVSRVSLARNGIDAMPPRSQISLLPFEIKSQLDKRLVDGAFSNYVALAEWLRDQGFSISKSAVHNYGQEFEERIRQMQASTAMAKAVVEATPDDENSMNEALMRIVQDKLFTVLMDMEIDPDSLDVSKIAKAIADLSRASVQQKKYMAEVKAKAREAAEAVVDTVKKSGLSAETVEQIRKHILGIAA